MKRQEETLQIAVCRYIDLQWPDVIYTSDLSGIKLPIGSAVKAKKQRCKRYKIPDLLILHPSNGYHGLAMELKKDLNEVFTKAGELRQNEHIIAQSESIRHLQSIGFQSLFVCGLDHAREVLKEYMG